MKTASVAFAFSLGAAILSAGSAMAAEKTVTLAVKNMDCASCPYIVQRSLTGVQGVERVAVSFKDKTATVTYNDGRTTLAALTAATAAAGYPSAAMTGPALTN
jgi:mercuric ion binding protein